MAACSVVWRVGGGGLCSYSILGFIWLHPKRQTLVGSLNGASLSISDSLALVGVYLVHQSICTLSTFFYVLAFVSCISVLAIIILSPSWQQNADHFQIANTCIDNDENINTTNNNNTNNEDKTTTCSTFKNIWKTIIKSKDVVVLFPGVRLAVSLLIPFIPSLKLRSTVDLVSGRLVTIDDVSGRLVSLSSRGGVVRHFPVSASVAVQKAYSAAEP